jgi:hypothetical protein
MRRLASQIHVTVVAVLVLFSVLVGVAWLLGPGEREEQRLADGLATTAGELLPGPDRPATELQAALERLGPRFGLDVSVFSPRRERLASVGATLPAPSGFPAQSRWIRHRGRGLVMLRLPDGRLLVAGRPHPDLRHLGTVATTLGQGERRPRRRGAGRADRRAAGGEPASSPRGCRSDRAPRSPRPPGRGKRPGRGRRRRRAGDGRRRPPPPAAARTQPARERGPARRGLEGRRARAPGSPETGRSFGLGLALVRQIARAHGGEARCVPRDGGGTVFEVDLGA